MLEVNAHIHIPEDEFHFTFVRSGGPGGQNVNKVASKAVLRWDVTQSPSLPDHVKHRLRALQRKRFTVDGELILSSQRTRDQDRNKQDCLDKLTEMVREAATLPKARRATRPSRASRTRRLEAKRRRGATKAGRRAVPEE